MIRKARAQRLVAVAALACTGACASNNDDPFAATEGTSATGGGAGVGGSLGGAAGAAGTSAGSAGASAGSAGTAGTAGDAGAGAGGTAAGAGGSSGGSSGAGTSGEPGSGTAGASGAAGGSAGVAPFVVNVELASNVNPSAPGTIGIVTWSLDGPTLTQANVEFGLDESYGTSAPVDMTSPDHRTLLLGMKPERTYHFRVVASDGVASYASSDHTVETGPPTTLVELSSFRVVDPAAREPGFIVTEERNGGNVVFVMDPDGEIVWWFAGGPADGIARARLSADGKNMWLVSSGNTGVPVMRVSMDTLDSQSYATTGGTHDITPVEGATMAYLDYGENDCTSIFEIDPTGNAHEVFESQGVVASGGCHGNAVRYSLAEDEFTYSDLSQDVLVLNRAGGVQWRLSERVSGGNGAWGGAQHGHQLLDDGLLIFANRGEGSNASAAIEYDLEGNERRRFPSDGNSANLGDVQRLPGGNTLITYSNEGTIEEVNASDAVVLEIADSRAAFGYSLWLADLYHPVPDQLE